MTLTEKLNSVACAVGGKAWGENFGKPRVYFNARLLHAKVFLEFPKAAGDNLGCPMLRIHHQRAGRQYALRKRITADEYRDRVLAARAWMQKNNIA